VAIRIKEDGMEKVSIEHKYAWELKELSILSRKGSGALYPGN
jgi:hypothetical protein